MAREPKERRPKNIIDIIAKSPEEILTAIKVHTRKNAPLDIDYIDYIKALDAINFSMEQLRTAREYLNNTSIRLINNNRKPDAEKYSTLAAYFNDRIAIEKVRKN